MKKLIAALFFLLLSTGFALSEDLPYIRQLPQYNYYANNVLSAESCPEARITPFSVVDLFMSYSPVDPLFVCFSGPEGGHVSDFSPSSIRYFDAEKKITYGYYAREAASYEVFLNNAVDDKFILLDGSDGMAAYIDPEKCQAYGLIQMAEFGKSAKLEIQIALDNLDARMPQENRVESLSAVIVPEVSRIKGEMRYELLSTFWTAGRFSGIKFLTNDHQTLFCLDFPRIELKQSDGSLKEEEFIITEVNDFMLEGLYHIEQDDNLEVKIEKDEGFGLVFDKLSEKDKDTFLTTLSDKRPWAIYCHRADDGDIISLTAEVQADLDKKENPRYIDIELFANGFDLGLEEYLVIIDRFASCLRVVPVDQDPYNPSETAAQAPAVDPEEPARDGWVCSICGQTNDEASNFCTGCGSEKPIPEASEEGWICPGCGQTNDADNKFCPECGTAKPIPLDPLKSEWTCPACGKSNSDSSKYCPSCGTAKPGAHDAVLETSVSLSDIGFFLKSGVSLYAGITKDSYNKPHTPYLCPGKDTAECEFLLEGEYKTFRATMFIPKYAMAKKTEEALSLAQIQVYGDDMLLFTCPTMGIKDPSTVIEVDVSGVKILKLLFKNCLEILDQVPCAVLNLGEPVVVK